jgi:hypothetical protein
VSRNLWRSCGEHTLEALFAGAGPEALDLAREYVALLESLGDVQVLAQKTHDTVGLQRGGDTPEPARRHTPP